MDSGFGSRIRVFERGADREVARVGRRPFPRIPEFARFAVWVFGVWSFKVSCLGFGVWDLD